jgi:hypothetical protein
MSAASPNIAGAKSASGAAKSVHAPGQPNRLSAIGTDTAHARDANPETMKQASSGQSLTKGSRWSQFGAKKAPQEMAAATHDAAMKRQRADKTMG